MASVDCQIRFGIAATSSPTAWAGSGGRRKFVDWLPKRGDPIGVLRDGKVYLNEPTWNFLREVADRLGGVQGASIPQVQQTVTATQAQVAETTSYAVQVSDFAAQIATTASTTAAVTQGASLPGSSSIPDPGDPPPRPGTHAR